MSDALYLTLMLGIIGVLTVVMAPSLLSKKCESCGARNMLDSTVCRKCGLAFPED